MNWFLRAVSSSIGKKMVMAITGLFFCLFLLTHLLGNLTIYGGKDSFDSYSERLHSLGLLLNVVEIGLLLSALLHISFAVLLYFENLRARPIRYVNKKRAGGRTVFSATMPYTGLLLLVFVVIHLFTFTFADRTDRTIFQMVSGVFSNPAYVIFYLFSMVVAAFHVRHGLWSAFQTVGANHPKYMPLIQRASIVFSLMVGVGFSSVPIFIISIT